MAALFRGRLFRIASDQGGCFLRQVAGIHPVIPKTGAGPAVIQTGPEFSINQLPALRERGARFVGLAVLIKSHRQNGINDGLAGGEFGTLRLGALTRLDGRLIITTPIVPQAKWHERPLAAPVAGHRVDLFFRRRRHRLKHLDLGFVDWQKEGGDEDAAVRIRGKIRGGAP